MKEGRLAGLLHRLIARKLALFSVLLMDYLLLEKRLVTTRSPSRSSG
jgi:hypothetical protein